MASNQLIKMPIASSIYSFELSPAGKWFKFRQSGQLTIRH